MRQPLLGPLHEDGADSESELARSNVVPSQVSKHRVNYFFPFDTGHRTGFDSGHIVERFAQQLQALTTGSLTTSGVVAPWLREGHSGAGQALWRECTRNVSLDLYPYVRRLSGSERSSAEQHVGCPRCFSIGDEALNWLTGKSGARGHGLIIAMNAQTVRGGQRDAGETIDVAVLIHNVHLQIWHSGLGLVILEVEYKPQDGDDVDVASLILHMNHLLCRTGQHRTYSAAWVRRATATTIERQPAPSLECLVSALLPAAKAAGTISPGNAAGDPVRLWRDRRRLFAYSYVAFENAVPDFERRMYAFRLSHRYTLDYAAADGSVDEVYAPFKDIAHSVCLEGGCVVVTHDTRLPFLTSFLTSAFQTSYLPLAIVAYHEYLYLLRATQESTGLARRSKNSRAHTETLRQLVADLAFFRLHFRFSQASQLTQQNRVYAMLRSALALDRLLAEAEEDARSAHGQYIERLWRLPGSIAIGLSAAIFAPQLFDLFASTDFSWSRPARQLIAVVSGLVVGGFFYLRGLTGRK